METSMEQQLWLARWHYFYFGTEQEGGWGAAIKDSLKTYHNLRKNTTKKTFVSKCLNNIRSQILEFVQIQKNKTKKE